MGCGASVVVAPGASGKYKDKEGEKEQTVVEWKILPSNVEARKKFEADGTLTKNSDPEHLELRIMLDDPFSQNAIGNHAKNIKAVEIFMCWVDIQEFKSIQKVTTAYRRSKALHIYHKYIKIDSVLEIGDIDLAERERCKVALDASKDDPEELSVGLYDKVHTAFSLLFTSHLQFANLLFSAFHHCRFSLNAFCLCTRRSTFPSS